MRSRDSVAATNSDEAPTTTSRWAIGVVAGLLLAIILWPLFKGATDAGADSKAIKANLAPACARWDERASETIARLLREGKRDADLQRVNDAVFRIRRARRNCQAGWITLACQDYSVIIRKVPGFTAAWPPISSVCVLTSGGEASTAGH